MLSKLRRLFGKQPIQPDRAAQPSSAGNNRNPANGFRLRLSVKGPTGQRDEEIDLVEILSRVLSESGREHSANNAVLTDTLSKINFRPGIVSFQPNDDLSMRTCTTIEVGHLTEFPLTFFEYQHSAGATGVFSVTKGFEEWARLDLPVVLDALSPELKNCTAMEFTFPNKKPRRVLLGPVSLLVPKQEEPTLKGTETHPPFCPCCLFSNSVEVFKPLVDSAGFAAVRLYAARSADGTAQADCRVNGEDFPAGVDALISYVRTWPGLNFEVRKQYIIIQDKPKYSGSLT
jgi:Family of unknown function (DUF6348)